MIAFLVVLALGLVAVCGLIARSLIGVDIPSARPADVQAIQDAPDPVATLVASMTDEQVADATEAIWAAEQTRHLTDTEETS